MFLDHAYIDAHAQFWVLAQGTGAAYMLVGRFEPNDQGRDWDTHIAQEYVPNWYDLAPAGFGIDDGWNDA